MTSQTISKKKRQLFLDVLSATGKVLEAAQAAGFTTANFLHRIRKMDKKFAEDWDDALDAAGDILEAEAIRRAVEGVMEPNYYKGEVVGYTVKYSDSLLTTMLKATKPDKYREKLALEGKLNANIGITILPMTSKSMLDWEQDAQLVHTEQKKLKLDLPDAEYTDITPESESDENELVRA